MASYERMFSALGAEADRRLAAAWTQLNELKQEVASLRLELARDKELLRTLQRSQETRGRRLARAREREAALLQQLAELGVELEDAPARESFFRTKATKAP
jgi:septal ring factor EnvC (AmiA/AmiB activator)